MGAALKAKAKAAGKGAAKMEGAAVKKRQAWAQKQAAAVKGIAPSKGPPVIQGCSNQWSDKYCHKMTEHCGKHPVLRWKCRSTCNACKEQFDYYHPHDGREIAALSKKQTAKAEVKGALKATTPSVAPKVSAPTTAKAAPVAAAKAASTVKPAGAKKAATKK